MTLLTPIDFETLAQRVDLTRRYRSNRARTARLFTLVREAWLERPLARRLPFVFYLGHLPVFSYVTLAQAYGLPPIDAALEALFRRGIDPATDAEGDALQPAAWPSIAAVEAYAAKADAAIERIFAYERLEDATTPMLVAGEALHAILEHEAMHQETLLYLIVCLDDAKRTPDGFRLDVGPAAATPPEIREIPAGAATLGAERGSIPFGWDNEFDAVGVRVERFLVESQPVTNARYAGYVDAGGAKPLHWFRREGAWWLRTALGAVPLPPAWPVYVSRDEADAFAAEHRARLMTEPEYQRAAYGSPEDGARRYPWGNAAPTHRYGTFDFARLVPDAVGSHPDGESAWGVGELVGNGWELTATPFAPLPGFRAMASYPVYSADFFDGRHYVVKGASPVTEAGLIRPSLRNWFYGDYPYAFTKFRLAYD